MLKIPHTTWLKPFLPGFWLALLSTVTLPAILLLCSQAIAGAAEIIKVDIAAIEGNSYMVSVTLKHSDTGWDHYANRWDVLDENGKLLGTRALAHPHVNEQPFTRSLRVQIPANVTTITIVAADSLHGDNDITANAVVPR